MLDSNPGLRMGSGSTPLQEASQLHLHNMDFGGKNEANISVATWPKWLGYVNAADHEELLPVWSLSTPFAILSILSPIYVLSLASPPASHSYSLWLVRRLPHGACTSSHLSVGATSPCPSAILLQLCCTTYPIASSRQPQHSLDCKS